MLDPISQAEIWRVLLDHVKTNNIGLLIISHEKLILKRLCDKLIDFSQLTKPIADFNRIE